MKDKKAIIRKDKNGMPIEILDIKSLSVEDFLKYQKICEVAQEESLKEEKFKSDLLEQQLKNNRRHQPTNQIKCSFFLYSSPQRFQSSALHTPLLRVHGRCCVHRVHCVRVSLRDSQELCGYLQHGCDEA